MPRPNTAQAINLTGFKHPTTHNTRIQLNGTWTRPGSPAMQRTFTLVPNAPSPRPAHHVRPMTTKQVRKAYKASTKTPPMSRAERMKQERAEQDRIRREFEKEKSAARAKIAREKKREKDLAEREHKKKLGMPLVAVRPSQDTIARFVRGNGSGKKRDSGGRPLGDVGGREEAAPAAGTSNHARPELDLLPDDYGSELDEMLDTMENGAAERDVRDGRGARAEDGSPPLHHTPKTAPRGEPRCEAKSPSGLGGEMKPPPRPCRARPQQPVCSPPPVIQQPPMSTQAILGSLDDFFPSPSQQALELQDETLDGGLDGSLGDVESLPRQRRRPRRLLTSSSGSDEVVPLAVRQSRRTAAAEGREDQGTAQAQAQAHHTSGEREACNRPDNSKVHTTVPPKRAASISKPGPSLGGDKENIQMESPAHASGISDSQETEYGGDWMDDLALDVVF
ncbi:uncharacterized protein MAM_00238 [Metarhizium album ARSEF 1941]|uniref:Uncharacterized protein n=1 Tax=Metarhizium album (strain ARSEF 1941) TaxID=1081103 RepID=A0A0B2WYB4_METAS|nr:uncharacterized protein MAM_00238 [Metarhizium album ARSEF 1941]KHO01237.1 hypothetical protein MAM_00238 [Metarhizium album ARSEF 1941]